MVGRTLAHYEVTGLLGKGGMGEVYRARDTKLGRDVALKILPKELSGDPERAARFEREARTLASLQHPNVASIYGFEEVDGQRFLVMELVEGEDLGARLREGKPSLETTVRVARQIATGLEAAHERGIVHRDLKPANIMLNDAGDAKILDFGLARAWFGDPNADHGMESSPTITAAMTQAGTILGTAAYMSPEQARGKNVDRRADIWAFGAILWEMVTGTRLFEGETISDTLAAVLRAEPEWEKLPVDEAPHLCRLIERCLVRDPSLRLRDIGEARILLQEGGVETSHLSLSSIAAGAPAPDVAEPPRSGLRTPVVFGIALVALALGALAGRALLAPAPEPLLLHTMIPAPPDTDFDMGGASPGPARLSPNGKMIVFTASGEDGESAIYLRHLDRGESVLLSGTEGAAYPFWSPGSDYVAYFTVEGADRKLRKIAVAGGPPVTICQASNGKGGTWNEDGVILFAPVHNTVLHRVPAIGGDPEPVTELGTDEESHRHPRFLPNGNDFLYTVRHRGNRFTIRMGSLDGREPVEITESECQAEYASGHLFTVREKVLFATPFDPSTGELSGGGMPLVEEVLTLGGAGGAGIGSYTVVESGMMAFQTGHGGTQDRLLSWGEADGEVDTPIGSPGQIYHPRISPDGASCIVEIRGEGQEGKDLWLVDLETGLRTRFTFDEGDEYAPCWTPDGQTIVYSAQIDSLFRIMERPVEGTGSGAILYEDDEYVLTTSVHPDGSGVLFTHSSGDSDEVSLEFLAFDGNGQPEVVLADEGYAGRYSPDGRWIAYCWRTPASGWDVFVIPAAGGTRKWQITTTGAVWPQWSADGKKLFAYGFGTDVIGFDVEAEGNSFRFGSMQELRAIPGGVSEYGTPFAVHPDGTRILHAGPDPSQVRSELSPIHLVTDWRRTLVQ